MPITENGYEYTIPQEWLNVINYEFLNAFRDELTKMKYISLDSFYGDSLTYTESTSGWNTAFKLACIKTNNKELYKYACSLEWFDSDLFDWELSKLLIKNKLILEDSFEELICEKLGVNIAEIETCVGCGKIFFKKDMVEDKEVEGYFHRIHCNGFDSHQYYLEGLNIKI